MDTSIGDLGVAQPQFLEARQSFQMHQPSVGHLRAVQIKVLEARESSQVYQPGVGDANGIPELLREAIQVLRAVNRKLQPPAQDPAPPTGSPSQDDNHKLEGKLSNIKAELAELKSLITAEKGEVVKEAYTVKEVATKTGFKDGTIRQACNKERIKEAYKARDGSWRIPHESLVDIRNNGLASDGTYDPT